MLAAIASLPRGATVALPYSQQVEMFSNTGTLLGTLWSRDDLRLVHNERADYCLILTEGPDNWRIGGRGLYGRMADPTEVWRKRCGANQTPVRAGGESIHVWIPPRVSWLLGPLGSMGPAKLTFDWELTRIDR